MKIDASPSGISNTGEGDPGDGWGDSGPSGCSTSTCRGACSLFSILQQYNLRSQSYDPPALIPTPPSDDSFIFLLTPTLHLFNFEFFPWIFSFLHLPEPDSYPNHKTSICTPEGPPTINVEEWRRWRRKEQMKNADLINFLIFFIVINFCPT